MTTSDEHELFGHPPDESPKQAAYDASMAVRDILLSTHFELEHWQKAKLTSAAIILEALSI